MYDPVAAPNASRVPDKGDAARAIEVTHVVRRVARRSAHLELSPAGRQPFVAIQRPDARGRHRHDGAPQPIHVLAVEPGGAGNELRRIDQVSRAALVDEHLDLGIRRQEQPGRARVIEMDVRQQQLTDVPNRYPLRARAFEEPVERGRRAGVDDRHPVGALQDGAGDDAGPAQKIQIDVVHAAGENAHVGSQLEECGFYRNPVKIMGIGMGDNERQTDGQLLERTRQETKKPELFKVLLLNDDYTTMEFVVEILENVFHKQPAEAYRIMMAVHTQGKGLCGVYPHEVAETKVATVIDLARESGFPLLAAMEPE